MAKWFVEIIKVIIQSMFYNKLDFLETTGMKWGFLSICQSSDTVFFTVNWKSQNLWIQSVSQNIIAFSFSLLQMYSRTSPLFFWNSKKDWFVSPDFADCLDNCFFSFWISRAIYFLK